MNAKDVLRYGQLTFVGAVESVPETDREIAGACGIWSVKDLVAHLASYELVLVDVLKSVTGEAATPHLDSIIELGGAFNDSEVDERRSRILTDVVGELADAHEETLQLVSSLSPETLRQPGTIPWYGEEYSVEDLIVYQYYGHKREHSAQIEMFRDHGVYRLAAGAARVTGR